MGGRQGLGILVPTGLRAEELRHRGLGMKGSGAAGFFES